MRVLRAYYDGSVFVPIENVEASGVLEGSMVNLTVFSGEESDGETARKLAIFERITDKLGELNETEPLPPEFYETQRREKEIVT